MSADTTLPTANEDMTPPVTRLLSQAFMQDPYPTLQKMREEHAAVPVENGGFRMWVVTRYDDARMILADPTLQRDLVKNRHAIVGQNLVDIERRPKLPRELRRSMLDQDGQDHRRLRTVISKYFSPRRLASLRPRIESVADMLLDQISVGEPIDLVQCYARMLPIICLSELLGVPVEDRAEFPAWETAILTAPTKAEVEDAGRQLYVYAGKIVEARRNRLHNDMLAEIVATAGQGVMSDAELISMITLLLIAGLEPSSAIASGAMILMEHPDQLHSLLDEPALMSSCVDEILRFETPFRMLTPRYLDHPVRLDDVTIPAGELILVSTGAANRDPKRYEDPDRFDVRRCPKGHLGFSHGEHRCLGAELGRLETSIALSKLFHRFPCSRLAIDPKEIRWRPGMFMRRIETLPVVLA